MGRDPYRSRVIAVAGRRGVITILVYPQCRYGIGAGHVRPGLAGDRAAGGVCVLGRRSDTGKRGWPALAQHTDLARSGAGCPGGRRHGPRRRLGASALEYGEEERATKKGLPLRQLARRERLPETPVALDGGYRPL